MWIEKILLDLKWDEDEEKGMGRAWLIYEESEIKLSY